MSHDRKTRQHSLDTVQNVAHEVYSIRGVGSAALAMAWVAAGRLDIYLNYRLKPWDVAAAHLIITEAGGTVTTSTDEGWHWLMEESSIIATNGHIHQPFIRLLPKSKA